MNTVALPASSARGALGHEATIARSAIRGDEEAFAELFRRHGQCAWRLAQAVAIGREAAAGAVCEGFTATLKDLRRHHKHDAGDQAFRVSLLASVYRAAVQELHDRPQPAQPVAARTQTKSRSKGKSADGALLESAFRSLPERWRAALWLSEVEAMPVESVGSSLGVSAAVATQLLTRAERGLAGRFAQARRPVPQHLGPALRPLIVALPAGLADEALEHWRAVAGLPVARLAPLGAWVTEHSERPLQVASAVLLAMGLVGLGVVGNASHTKAGPTAVSTPPSAQGAVGVNSPSSSGVPVISPPVPFSALGQNSALSSAAAAAATAAATNGTGGGASTGSAVSSQHVSSASTSPASSTSPSGHSSTSGGGGTTSHTNPAPSTNPGTTLNLGVATVNVDSGGLSVKVLPTSTGSAASATLGSRSGCATGLSLTVGTTTIGCSLTNPITSGTTAGTTTTNSAPSSSLTSALSGAVSAVTQTVTSVLSKTLGNL